MGVFFSKKIISDDGRNASTNVGASASGSGSAWIGEQSTPSQYHAEHNATTTATPAASSTATTTTTTHVPSELHVCLRVTLHIIVLAKFVGLLVGQVIN
jgi:hypothetical protein